MTLDDTAWHADMPDEFRDRIIEGDALELIKRLPDDSIDVLMADPDYGVGVDYGHGAVDPNAAIEFVAQMLELVKPKSRTGTAVIF